MKKLLVLFGLVCSSLIYGQREKPFAFQMRQLKRRAKELTPTKQLLRVDTMYKKKFDQAEEIKDSVVSAHKDNLLSENEYLKLLANYFALKYDLQKMQSDAYKKIAQEKKKDVEKLERTKKLLKFRKISEKGAMTR